MNTARSVLRSSVTLALVAFAAACGPFRMGSAETAAIVFTNDSIDQADVYAVGPDGAPFRLGTVLAGQTSTLTVPATVLGQGGNINVAARLLAHNRAPQTGAFSLRTGDQVRVRLPSDEKTLIVLPQ